MQYSQKQIVLHKTHTGWYIREWIPAKCHEYFIRDFDLRSWIY